MRDFKFHCVVLCVLKVCTDVVIGVLLLQRLTQDQALCSETRV